MKNWELSQIIRRDGFLLIGPTGDVIIGIRQAVLCRHNKSCVDRRHVAMTEYHMRSIGVRSSGISFITLRGKKPPRQTMVIVFSIILVPRSRYSPKDEVNKQDVTTKRSYCLYWLIRPDPAGVRVAGKVTNFP